MGEATPVADPDPVRVIQNETDSEVAQDGPAIWERIRRRVDVHLGNVEMHAHRLLERDLTSEEAETASSAAGGLALELGLLELPSTARIARQLAASFQADTIESTTGVHVAAATEDIRTLVASAIAQQQAAVSGRGTVVVAGEPGPTFDALCWVVASRGFAIRTSATTEDQIDPVAAIVVAEQHGDASAAPAIQAVAESWDTPILVLSATNDVVELRHLTRHASSLLPLDTPPAAVVDDLARVIAASTVRPSALLCGVGPGVTKGFEAHGFETVTMASPEALVGLSDRHDAVIVFGLGVADVVVVELAKVLRTSPATRRVPILWHHDPSVRPHALAASRLGVITVDVVDDAVIANVNAQLRLNALDHAEQQNDAGTMLNWAAGQVLVDRSLVTAQRANASVAFASIDIGSDVADDALATFVESFGREFRRGDIVCRRSDRNLVVALQGVSRRVATSRMTELFDRYELEDGTSRVGVSVFPNDGRSAAELAVGADAAQALAKRHQGPRIVSTTWRPEAERAVDVLVVDPDAVVASVLTSAFEDRGLRATASHDGRDALGQLTGNGEHRLPKLILLDLDTPGLDGLALVRRLASAGVLAQTSILLMAARSTEADLRLALELGVSDIIRKPFSTTLLLHRAGRLLEDRR